MEDPISILYCWQALVVAVSVIILTHGIKATIDIVWGRLDPAETPTVKDMASLGKARRKANTWLREVVLPGLPVIIGSVFAMLVPLYPDALQDYIAAHRSTRDWLMHGAWGAAVGQMSTYLYDRVLGTVRAARPSQDQE